MLNLIKYIIIAMFSINAQPSTFINMDNTLDKLETVLTPLGSLHLIETNSVDNIMAGVGRNVYFPPDISNHIIIIVYKHYSFIYFLCIFSIFPRYSVVNGLITKTLTN